VLLLFHTAAITTLLVVMMLLLLQGAFVLLGTTPGQGADVAMLLIMMIALLCYIAWRFGEAFLGQGYDAG
jgi:amino acid permease